MGRSVPRVPLHLLILLFLLISEIFSSAGESSVQDLIGAVGDSVTFPISVPVSGNIIYNSNTVGLVLNKQSDTELSEKFVNRLQWVSQSGFFTLSDLRTDDSGLYTVESTKEQKGKQDYQLEVYGFSVLFPLSEIFSSAGESSVQDLIGAVGDSVTFPISVPVFGTMIYNSNTVGQVFNKQNDTDLSEKFVNRLQWVSQSGFFTLSDLRTDDSGLYTVESTKEQKGKQDYQLEVYERVSAPQLMNTTSSSSEFCSFLCSVRDVRGLKLSVYEDAVLLNRSSSSSSNTSDITLNLHLEIKKTNNHRERTFSCVASNPVSNKTTTIIITHSCSLNTGADVGPPQSSVSVTVICTVLLAGTVMTMCVCLWKRKRNKSSHCIEHG
ncbi:SLAM family member 7-like isoform X2, partial [Clarias magur]